ncbi:hypothetical protein AA700_1338 [Acidiphilium acidophilum DSM 700]|nr:hypothetical protein AA700_1338 [Acidiphilium acidophilum DSM 700]
MFDYHRGGKARTFDRRITDEQGVRTIFPREPGVVVIGSFHCGILVDHLGGAGLAGHADAARQNQPRPPRGAERGVDHFIETAPDGGEVAIVEPERCRDRAVGTLIADRAHDMRVERRAGADPRDHGGEVEGGEQGVALADALNRGIAHGPVDPAAPGPVMGRQEAGGHTREIEMSGTGQA